MLFLAIALILILIILYYVATVNQFVGNKKLEGTRWPVGPNASIADSKHYWTDGVNVFDCAECLEQSQCRHCPQFNPIGIEGMEGDATRDAASDAASDATSDATTLKPDEEMHLKVAAAAANCNPDELYDRYAIIKEFSDDTGHYDLTNNILPAFDLDPEFISKRTGACLSRSTGERAGEGYSQTSAFWCTDTSMLGTRNDDIFDGERSIDHSSARGCKAKVSPLKLLYTDRLGLDRPAPMTDCEYQGVQGYVYKESCLQ